MNKLRTLAAFLAVFAALQWAPAFAEEPNTGNATTETYTLENEAGETGAKPTQDAYLTGEILFLDEPLTAPEDLFVRDGYLYAADTGAGRVVRVDLSTGENAAIGDGALSSPTGVFVTEQGEIYVADGGRQEVVVFSPDGRLLRTYGRPASVTFGERAQYQPAKVAVSDAGTLYIVSTGSFDGVIQLDASGEFLGYYGYNNVPMTALEMLQDLIFTDEQKARLFQKIPLAFYNLAIDEKGLCYTVTQRTKDAPLKKHNIAGVNILPGGLWVENLADVCIGPDGLIFAVDETGYIYEMDNDGSVLFILGGQAYRSERRGLCTLASGIAADDNCTLYVMDKERGLVHTFIPTQYALQMHEAIRQYQNGEYEASQNTLQELSRIAGSTTMINYFMGNNYMQLHDYAAAQESYRRAGDPSGYSDAFWEVRIERVSRWFGWGVLGLLVLAGALLLWGKRTKKPRETYFYTDGKKAAEIGLRKNLVFAFRFFKHPFNSFYEVKIGARGTAATGCILYLLAFLSFSFYFVGQGFAFSQTNLSNTSPAYLTMLFFLPVGLFVVASYMVSEINSGEGSFGRMFAGMAYSMIPLICLLPPLTLLTHVLTQSEAFLVNFGAAFIFAWTGVLVLLSIKEIHGYEPGQVAMNVVLTLFLMVVMIFAGSIIGMFWDTVLDTVSALVREVCYRVFG